MALRVLLADESSTIKKVIQLALQDYAVEVQAVNVGLDVAVVAKKFKPDIVFADILLQKRSGYEVSADIKNDPELQSIPVVLMWSGFLELDEDKFQVAKADAQLEKPFDVATLRKLVQTLVPKTKTQDLSQYLTLPPMPQDFIGELETPKPNREVMADLGGGGAATATPPVPPSSWDMDKFEPIEKFASPEESFREINLPKKQDPVMPPPSDDEILGDTPEDSGDGQWVQTRLQRFQVNVPEEDIEVEDQELAVEYVVPDDPSEPDLELELEEISEPAPPPTPAVAHQVAPAVPSGVELSAEKIEEIIRSQSRDLIESVVWKVVPDLAKQLIEKEIRRLLAEQESSQL